MASKEINVDLQFFTGAELWRGILMSDRHRKKIIDSLELNGELIMLEDGYQYFAPRSGAGAISANDLRIIADELDRRNQKWDEQVKREIGGEQ